MSDKEQPFIEFDFKEKEKKFSVNIKYDVFLTKGNLFSDVNYALFSTISENEKFCSVYLIKETSNYFEFRAKSNINEDEKILIKECRDIAYAYLSFACIPTVIQSPYERLTDSYFIDVGSSPYQKFPGLARLVYPENMENICIVFNSNEKFFNKVGSGYAKAMGGLSPTTNKYRVTFRNIDEFKNAKFLHQHPIANHKIPGYAKLCTKDNFQAKIPPKYEYGNPFTEVSPNKHIFKDESEKDCFYVTSYVDIGFPNESMIAASASSNSLFLTPDYGQVRFDQKKPFNYFKYDIIRLLFRSKNYDDPYQNMLSFAAAFKTSKNIIIPFTVPCYDTIKMLSLFIENLENLKIQFPEYGCKKEIIFFIDLPKKGKESTNFPADCEFNRFMKMFSQMEFFRKSEKKEIIFKLCKSVQELVEHLRDVEFEDLEFIYNTEQEKRRELIVKYNDIRNGLESFLNV